MQQANKIELEEEDDEFFATIDKLIAQGINAGDLKKLQDAGIYTCNGLMMNTKKDTSSQYIQKAMDEVNQMKISTQQGMAQALNKAAREEAANTRSQQASENAQQGTDAALETIGQY